ncbi:MAG: class I SAM-dependent methyltransferase [Bdellovibrionales bacterium]
MDELDEIRQRYERRKMNLDEKRLYPTFSPFQHYSRAEREFWFDSVLTRRFLDGFEDVRFLEVGAGDGANLAGFLRLGVRPEHLYANELLPERAQRLSRLVHNGNIFIGDARLVPWNSLDVIFQSMVFSSILDPAFRQELARSLWSRLSSRGLILWYDLRVDNPYNPDVKGLGFEEVCSLFPEATRTEFHRCTLVPPIGRRVGRLYPFVNLPFLRGHYVAALYK